MVEWYILAWLIVDIVLLCTVGPGGASGRWVR
jgi:hypothetical protein